MRPARVGLVLLALLFLLAGCRQDRVTPREGAVATAHPEATRAALDVLREGGNAADAAVTAAFVLAVVEPYSSGLGGGGFLLIHQADGVDRSLDARETAPAAAHRGLFVRDGEVVAELSRTGALSVATPSLVPGLAQFHAECGSLPWRRLVEPAVRLAREGFRVDNAMAERIAAHRDRFDAAARAVFLPAGRPPATGEILRQQDLARTLERVATLGGEEFRSGETARAIVESVRRAGGLLEPADLARYLPVWREPVRGAYRGRTVVSMPPPSSGGVHLVQMLNILGAYDLSVAPPHAPGTVHRMAEAMKFAYADRSRWLGDPDFAGIPVVWLTSVARADSQRALIKPDTVLDWRAAGGVACIDEGTHTTHLSVVDADGGAVAATLTVNLGFGSGMMAAGTGVILNDEMDDFAAAPGVPNAFGLVGSEANAVAPGKRPLSSMTPTILLRDGTVELVTGSPGGSRIITTTLQTILNVIDFGLDAHDAVALPRIHHQWWPTTLFYEPGSLDAAARDRLAAMGHDLQEGEPMGNVQLIRVDPVDGTVEAASDPRGVGAAGTTTRRP